MTRDILDTRWRFAWAWTVAAVLVLAGCGGAVINPQPPAPPSAPSPICEVGATCGCWHQPPGQDWQRLPDCAPAPSPGCVIDGAPGAILPGHKPTLGPRVNAAMARLTGCSPGSRCIVAARPLEWQRAVAAELRRDGLCSGQHTPDTDEIAIAECFDCVRESGHIYQGAGWDDPTATGNVVWFKELPGGLVPQEPPFVGAARPSYAAPAGPAPVPTPGPSPAPSPTPGPPPAPPAGDCPAPLPARVWTEATLPDGWGREEIGRPRWQLNCRPHGRVIDCTPVVIRNEPHCAAIGLSPYADGQPRQSCPVRPDGHPDRVACERYLLGGELVIESRNGAACERTAPTMFEPNGGGCRLCSPDRAVCSEWQ